MVRVTLAFCSRHDSLAVGLLFKWLPRKTKGWKESVQIFFLFILDGLLQLQLHLLNFNSK